MVPEVVDCYTVSAWWLEDSRCDMRHGLHLAGIAVLWLLMNIDWEFLQAQCIIGKQQCIVGSPDW